MKKIYLKRLILSNWRSLNSDVTFGESTKILAFNGVGKTSLQCAWNWLLSGYTSADEPKNYNLYDNKCDITPETPIASVKAWVEVDGLEYTIEKRAKAKFSRKRGTSEWVKDSSDEYIVLIDEIETSATDYAMWLEHNICKTSTLPYCLDGGFFASLVYDDKKEARKILEAVVGEISTDDFSGDYSMFKNDFAKGYSIEQIEERTKRELNETRKKSVELDAVLKSKERSLSEYSTQDFDGLKKEIETCKADIDKIDAMILNKAESIKPLLGERNALFELINSKTLKNSECRNAYLNTFKAATSEIKGKINEINASKATLKSLLETKKETLARNQKTLAYLQEHRARLVERKNEIKGRVFSEGKCAYCGQELPDVLLEEAMRKFNKQKQEDLEACVAQGKNTRNDIDDILAVNKKLEEEISQCEQGLNEYPDIEELEARLKAREQSFVPYEETDEYKKMHAELDDLNAKFNSLNISKEDEALTAEKKKLMLDLEDLYIRYGFHKKAEELREEIAKLQTQIRECGISMARLEGVLSKCREYIEERAEIISERVNGKLKGCKIRMWERQKNGEIVPACIITDEKNVRLATTNTANKITIHLALQDLFCKHFGITLPKWIDEAAVFAPSNEPCVDGQSIMLYPSEDKVLRIENI